MSFDRPTLKVENEATGMPCGFDFESFAIGFDCPSPATRALVDTSDNNFHWAHLCPEHATIVAANEEQNR